MRTTLIPSKRRGAQTEPGDPSDVEDVNTKREKHTKTLQMTSCHLLLSLHGSRTGGSMAVAPGQDVLGPIRITQANLRLISAEWKWHGCSEPSVVNGMLPLLLL